MQKRLDQMVRNCATTLEDLDTATKKYRNGTQSDGRDPGALPGTSTANRRVKLQRRLASNVMRIRWDMDKNTLRIYRDKLQSHTDAINLVLNTFVWSTTQKIHTDSRANAERTAHLHNSMATSNSELAQLMEDILAVVKTSDPLIKSDISVSAQRVNGQISRSPPVFVTSHLPTESSPTNTSRCSPPSHIESLNAKRMANVSQVLLQSRKPIEELPPANQEMQIVGKATTVAEVLHELDKILLRDLDAAAKPDFKAEVVEWTRRVDSLLASRVEAATPVKENQDLVEVILHVNEALEIANQAAREAFYESSKATNIDSVLSKIPRVACSVRAKKEIGDFIDARDEWEEMQRDKQVSS